jgi:hypothetical protein
MEFDSRELVAALRQYKAATKKDSVSIIRRAMRNICFRAIKFTKEANVGAIIEALTQDRSLFRILNAKRVKQGLPAIGNKPMSAPSSAFLLQRINSVHYIGAGWFVPLLKMGEPVHARKKLSDKQMQDGQAITPSLTQLDGIVVNGSFGGANAEAGREGLQRAVDDTARDMSNFAIKQMVKTAEKFSGK